MLEGRDIYFHLVPHSHKFTPNVYKDPLLQVLFKKDLIPKVDLLILEAATTSLDYKSNLRFHSNLRKFYLEIKSSKNLAVNLDQLDSQLKIRGFSDYEKFDIRYFLKNGAKDIVFESMLYDKISYESVKDLSAKIEESDTKCTNYLGNGEVQKSKEMHRLVENLLSQEIELRDNLLKERIEKEIVKRNARNVLIKFGPMHIELGKYFDPQGGKSLLVITDPFVIKNYEVKDESYYRRHFLTGLIGNMIKDSYDIESIDLANDIVKSFNQEELKELEKELEERLKSAAAFNQVSYEELTWHLDEMFREKLNEKGMLKLMPEWKFL